MNGRRDAAGPAAHRATQDSLPWLLSGRLGEAELAAAQAHLRDCAACRADLDSVRRLREAAALPDPDCDADAALARLQARIDAAAPAEPSPPARRRAANDAHWLRRVALAQFGVIVLLGALLAWRGTEADGAYRGLGAAPAEQAQAVVVFRPETPERELRRIVQASGARIVGGPTVTGAWVLALPEDGSAGPLARLRAEPAVLLAEPLGGAGRP